MRPNTVTAGIVVVYLSLLVADGADAQTWRSVTIAHGLVDNRVNVLLEDRQRNLWVGTDAGLSQFDGFFVTHLNGMKINALLESSDGAIWAGTSRGLYRYDGTMWQEQVESATITTLLQSRDGTIWVGTLRDGLHRYDGETWTQHLGRAWVTSLLASADGAIWVGTNAVEKNDRGLFRYAAGEWVPHLNNIGIGKLLESSNRVIWAGTSEGLYRFDGLKWVKQRWGISFNLWTFDPVIALLESSDGAIWAWSTVNGLQRYDGSEWMQQLAPPPYESFYHLLESSDGTIWAGGGLSGLRSFDGGTWEEQLSGDSITALLESSDGTLWAGTTQGLRRLDRGGWTVMLPKHQPDERPLVFALLESSDGAIWAGTFEGLYQYDGRLWTQHLPGKTISTLLQSSDGTLWAGTKRGGGLHRYNGLRWSVEGQLPRIEEISALLESSDGAIWAGTSSGLYHYDRASWIADNRLPQTDIRALIESKKDGTLWAGTKDGVYRYDGTTWQLAQTSAVDVRALLESSDGTIWIGGRNFLVRAVYPELGRRDGTKWTEVEALRGMVVLALLESSDGTLWVGTDHNGVQRYDGNVWGELTRLDGLPDDTVPAILEDGHGNLWFAAGLNGIGVYRPSKSAPGIQITNPKAQRVKSGSPSLFIEWIAGDFNTEAHRLRYQYQIDDAAWSIPTSLTFVTLLALDNGQHLFNVRAIDHELNYSQPAVLTIDVDIIQPNVLISNPVEGAVVGGIVRIMGGVTDPDLAEFQVEYAAGETPSDGDFRRIHTSVSEVELGQLGEWDTTPLTEGKYTIRVRAIDQLDHTRDDTVTVTVDNTKPIVEITSPRQNNQVSGVIVIKGTATDANTINTHLIKFEKNPPPTPSQEGRTEDAVRQGEIPSDGVTWNPPEGLTGIITLRLIATDPAGNAGQASVMVEIRPVVEGENGGEIRSTDGNLLLSFPPDAFSNLRPILTISPVPTTEIAALPNSDFHLLGTAYDIEMSPSNTELKKNKRLTLEMSYASESTVTDPAHLALFRQEGQTWRYLGGTADASQQVIRTAITQLGQYALFDTGGVVLDEGPKVAEVKCHPQAFSPHGGPFGNRTAISFGLAEPKHVSVKVYTMAGRLIRVVREGDFPSGMNLLYWDGRNDENDPVTSGPYLVTVKTKDWFGKRVVVVLNQWNGQ